jgi:hypothetical protein
MISHVKRWCVALGVLALAGSAPKVATADPGQSRFGAVVGASFPHGELDFDPAFAWGFFTDIPLGVSWFYLSPSAVVYELDPQPAEVEDGEEPAPDPGGRTATDVSLNFKFAADVSLMELFVGVTFGLTAAAENDVHFGGLGGAAFEVTESFDIYASFNYKVILTNDGNVQDAKILAGPAFRF